MRILRAVLLSVVVTIAGTSCELPSLGGGTAPPATGEPRIKADYPSPMRYRPANAKSFQIGYLSGSVRLTGRPAAYRLDFRVDNAGGRHPLLSENLESWARWGGRPERFTVDGGEAYRAERAEPAAGKGVPAPGRLFFVAAKGPIAVSLIVSAPPATPLTDAQRRAARRLFTSIRFTPEVLRGEIGTDSPAPVVPFSYVRPSGLTGGTRAEGGRSFVTTLWMADGQTVRVELTSYGTKKKAHRAYEADERRRPDLIPKGTAHDLTPAVWMRDALGRKVDEGFGYVRNRRADNEPVSERFVFREGRLLIRVGAEVRPDTLSRATLECVASILLSTTLTQPAL